MGTTNIEWTQKLCLSVPLSMAFTTQCLHIKPMRLTVAKMVMIFRSLFSTIHARHRVRPSHSTSLHGMIGSTLSQYFVRLISKTRRAALPIVVLFAFVGIAHFSPGIIRHCYAAEWGYPALGGLSHFDLAAIIACAGQAVATAIVYTKAGQEFPPTTFPTMLKATSPQRLVLLYGNANAACGYLKRSGSTSHNCSPSGLNVQKGPFDVK